MGLPVHSFKNAIQEERDGNDVLLGRQSGSPISLYNTASFARFWGFCKWDPKVSL